MKRKKLMPFAKLAREMAMNDWGIEATNKDDILKASKPEETTEFALLEIVRRINQAIAAWSADKGLEDEHVHKRPADAIIVPGVKVGDQFFYCNDLDQEPRVKIVVHVDNAGYARTVTPDEHEESENKTWLWWLTEGDSRTASEAVRKQAHEDIEYHLPQLDRAMAIVAAIDAGGDFVSLMKEIDD